MTHDKFHHNFVFFLSSLETFFESFFGLLVPDEAEQLLMYANIWKHDPVKQLELLDHIATSLFSLLVWITLLFLCKDEGIEVLTGCLKTVNPRLDQVLQSRTCLILECLKVALAVKLFHVRQVRGHCHGSNYLWCEIQHAHYFTNLQTLCVERPKASAICAEFVEHITERHRFLQPLFQFLSFVFVLSASQVLWANLLDFL